MRKLFKRKIPQLVSILLSALLTAASVSGCSSSQETSTSDKAKDSSVSSSSFADSSSSTSLSESSVEDSNETASNSNDQSVADNTYTNPAALNIGDIYTFGSYEQDNDTSNGKEPIEWIVLDKKDDSMLLISKYALDRQPYYFNNDTKKSVESITWETCTLRTWLNNEFFNRAFSSEEQSSIKASTLSANKNPQYDTPPGNDTVDKIFLLSIDESNNYFDSDEKRQCEGTNYCSALVADKTGMKTRSDNKHHWWLRSPGGFSTAASTVQPDGTIWNYGYVYYFTSATVRPAMWIKI